jgi:NDP-sugar pyrophosphorylase family protein
MLDLVIPAAGKGSRMQPLTGCIPKSLLPLPIGSILSSIFDAFGKQDFESIYLVISEQQDAFYEAIPQYLRHKIFFVMQPKPAGLGSVIDQLRGVVLNDFMFVYGDCIYAKSDLTNLRDLYDKGNRFNALLHKVKPALAQDHSLIEWTDDKHIAKVVSKPKESYIPSNDAVVAYTLPHEIFQVANSIQNRLGEYSLSNLVNQIIDNQGFKSNHIFTTSLSHATTMNDFYHLSLKQLNGKSYIGKNVTFKDECEVINSIIYDNCHIFNCKQIKNSIVFPRSVVSTEINNCIVFDQKYIQIQ